MRPIPPLPPLPPRLGRNGERVPEPIRIPDTVKRRLTVMLLAKHAGKDGKPDAEDGNHAVYHHELKTTLEEIGLNVVTAGSYDALSERPDVDFVIPLLNRGGFVHSEMLAPLQLTRHGVPFLGASPIIRGLTDNKHLTKLVARARGVATAEWKFYRRNDGPIDPPDFVAERLIVKPNASSASWGIGLFDNWNEAVAQVRWLHERGHDAIVEEWLPLIDIGVPVIGGTLGRPWILPPMIYSPEDPFALRSYEEKRGLVPTEQLDPLQRVEDLQLVARLETAIEPLLEEFWPFDYGRFEFRFDPATGALSFMEVNLSCNLWSKKTISRSAQTFGLSHRDVVETIVAHSLGRQRLMPAARACPVY
jgi:D-alanine-D-alanine ligase